MKIMKDLAFLQSELIRVSNWIEFADKKAGFLGVFYSAILVFVFTQHKDIICGIFYYESSYLVLYILSLSTLLSLLAQGFYFLFRAVLPNLKNLNTNHSLFYYGTVASKKIADYLNEMTELTGDKANKEITEQIYTNCVIADKKMKYIRKATQTLFAVIVVLAIVVLFT